MNRPAYVLLLCGPVLFAAQQPKTTTLAVTVAPACAVTILSVVPGPNAPPGQQQTQTVTFNYKVRTATSNGNGNIVMSLTTSGSRNFPNGSKVDYQTNITGPGTAKSGTVATTTALNSGIEVVTFSTGAHSVSNGATGTVTYTVNPTPPSNFGPLLPTLSISCH